MAKNSYWSSLFQAVSSVENLNWIQWGDDSLSWRQKWSHFALDLRVLRKHYLITCLGWLVDLSLTKESFLLVVSPLSKPEGGPARIPSRLELFLSIGKSPVVAFSLFRNEHVLALKAWCLSTNRPSNTHPTPSWGRPNSIQRTFGNHVIFFLGGGNSSGYENSNLGMSALVYLY